jgi:type VI secretion system protein ImpI
MTLTLRIENYDTLEDGGPTWLTLNQGHASVGRRPAMDWVLPDPAKHVSGHHFDITFRDGTYWLTDVSTNGTFLQGQPHRLQEPLALRGGERLIVAHYVISITVEHAHGGVWPNQPTPQQAVDEIDPWDFGGNNLHPVNPLPTPAGNPHHLDDVAQDFVPLQRPTIPPGRYPLPIQQPGQGAPTTHVQRPPQPSGAMQVSQPPFVPRPSPSGAAPVQAPMPQPSVAPMPPFQPTPEAGAVERAIVEAFCRGAGLNPALAARVDASALAEALGQSVRAVTDETMRMLQDRANVKHFTRGGERTMRSATGNNPMKFLGDGEQAVEAMFIEPKDGFMTGPDGFRNAMGDLRQHQMAVFAALQPALAEALRGLSPDEIEGREATSGNLLGSGKGRNWDTFVKRWDEKASEGDNGMLDVFLRAFSQAYMQAVTRGQP